LHDLLPGFGESPAGKEVQKEKTKKKIQENLTDKQQREEKKKKMISYGHTDRFLAR